MLFSRSFKNARMGWDWTSMTFCWSLKYTRAKTAFSWATHQVQVFQHTALYWCTALASRIRIGKDVSMNCSGIVCWSTRSRNGETWHP